MPRITCLLLAATVMLSACGGRDNLLIGAGPEAIYELGTGAMQSANYQLALAYFQQLEARYPFSNVTRQAQLDMIYLHWKARQPIEAVAAAEEFERENPTHPRVDYCLYMKGLIYFDQAPNFLERLFRVDMSVRPPKDSLLAFSTFQDLIRRFPDSRYVADARERMIFLRNRLAAYENHVANYYMEREAYLAAANRAKYALEHYPGAPALEQSLQILVDAYNELGMTDLAADAERVHAETFGGAGTGETARLR